MSFLTLIEVSRNPPLPSLPAPSLPSTPLPSTPLPSTQDLSARITDLGMARSGPESRKTHVSTRVQGSTGYIDPSYMETGEKGQGQEWNHFTRRLCILVRVECLGMGRLSDSEHLTQ